MPITATQHTERECFKQLAFEKFISLTARKPFSEPKLHWCHMKSADLRKTECWVPLALKRCTKREKKKSSSSKQRAPTTAKKVSEQRAPTKKKKKKNPHTECYQDQTGIVQIGRHETRKHRQLSSAGPIQFYQEYIRTRVGNSWSFCYECCHGRIRSSSSLPTSVCTKIGKTFVLERWTQRWTLYFDEHVHAKCRPSLKCQSKRWSFWRERACTCSALSA